MFASLELAAQIEAVEGRLTKDAVGSFRSRVPGGDAFSIDVGLGVAGYLRPGSPMNKVIGVFSDVPSTEELENIEHHYRTRAEPVRVELSTLAQPEIGRVLTERGYRLLGFENVLGQELRAGKPPLVHPDISIERVTDPRVAEWNRVIIDGFAHPDETGVVVDSYSREVIEQVMSDFLALEGLIRYLATHKGLAAGGASMRPDGGVVLMTGAATLAEHRRQGVQGSLLERRLRDALSLGARSAIITTSGGTRSQANAMRQGFSLLYSRAILVLDTVPAKSTV
jgi:hypothetical protein